jgi:hypothetical protein
MDGYPGREKVVLLELEFMWMRNINLQKKPPYVSGVLGLSYLTLQPALIVGTDRFYASVGAVLILIPSLNSRDEFSGVAGLAKLAVGYSFGSKFKLTPEIGAIFPITEGEFPGSPYYTAFGISIRP